MKIINLSDFQQGKVFVQCETKENLVHFLKMINNLNIDIQQQTLTGLYLIEEALNLWNIYLEKTYFALNPKKQLIYGNVKELDKNLNCNIIKWDSSCMIIPDTSIEIISISDLKNINFDIPKESISDNIIFQRICFDVLEKKADKVVWYDPDDKVICSDYANTLEEAEKNTNSEFIGWISFGILDNEEYVQICKGPQWDHFENKKTFQKKK